MIEILKENKILENLSKEIKENKLSHGIMLISDDDFALTTYSTEISKMLMCENLQNCACQECLQCRKIMHNNHADVVCYPKVKNVIATEEILEIVNEAYKTPFETNKKIFILNNASEMNNQAQNKLLKTLEEPPLYLYFILNVSNESKVLPTVKSRCRKIYLPKFTIQQIKEELKEYNLSSDVLEDVLIFSNGSIALAKKFAQDETFVNTVNFVLDLWLNMTHSSLMLKYASKLYLKKNSFEDILKIFSKVAELLIYEKTKTNKLQLSTKRQNQFSILAEQFSLPALKGISENCITANERLQRNCNYNITVDMFLMSFLEEKNKWR